MPFAVDSLRMRNPRARMLAAVTLLLGMLVAVVGCGDPSTVADSPWQEAPLGTDAEFHDIFFLDHDHGWMVGGGFFVDGGIVARTTDGGASWDYRTGIAHGALGLHNFSAQAVHFFDARSGCLVGTGGGVFLTRDGGLNWVPVRIDHRVYAHLFDVHFIDRLNGWIAGTNGIYATRDGGESWGPVIADYEERRYSSGWSIFFHDASVGWVCGKFSDLRYTNNGGRSWSRIHLVDPDLPGDQKPDLRDMDWPDRTHGWIVGEQGTILATSDGGSSWAFQDGGSASVYFTSVDFIDSMRGWVVGYERAEGKSLVLHTTNGGMDWSMEYEVAGEELQAVQFLDDSGSRGASQSVAGWAVGDRTQEQPQRMLRYVSTSSQGTGS